MSIVLDARPGGYDLDEVCRNSEGLGVVIAGDWPLPIQIGGASVASSTAVSAEHLIYRLVPPPNVNISPHLISSHPSPLFRTEQFPDSISFCHLRCFAPFFDKPGVSSLKSNI